MTFEKMWRSLVGQSNPGSMHKNHNYVIRPASLMVTPEPTYWAPPLPPHQYEHGHDRHRRTLSHTASIDTCDNVNCNVPTCGYPVVGQLVRTVSTRYQRSSSTRNTRTRSSDRYTRRTTATVSSSTTTNTPTSTCSLPANYRMHGGLQQPRRETTFGGNQLVQYACMNVAVITH